MADQEVVKHIKAAIDASRDKKKDWRHKVQDIALEVFIIVFAVSLSIWLHGWAEDRKDRREEHEFLVGLKQDLEADLKEMVGDRNTYARRQELSQYFERVGAGEKLNPDSAKAYSWIFNSWSMINPRVSRFEALKGSGRLDIIGNRVLLNQITELYTKDFPWIRTLNDYITSLKMNYMMPYLATHEQLDDRGNVTNWAELVRQPQMRVLVYQQRELFDNAGAYTTGIEHCEKILAEIGRELK